MAGDLQKEKEPRDSVQVNKAIFGWKQSSSSYTGAEVSRRVCKACSSSWHSWEQYDIHVHLYFLPCCFTWTSWTCIKTKPNQTKSVISLYFCMEKAQTCTCCCCCFVVLRATLHITLHNRDILKKENCRYRWFMVLWKMSVLWNQCLSQKLKERQDCFSKNGHKSHKVYFPMYSNKAYQNTPQRHINSELILCPHVS